MRVAIIGSGGQLGRELVARIDPADAVPLTHKQIEITDRASIAKILDKHEPRCVINAAAYNFVDRANTLGLGPNVPLANGTNSDSLLALQPDGRWVTLRVPYPLGFFSRGMDGRIDDPNGGWKGRAMYADYGQNAVWHIEGGKGTRSSVVKFQLRPDPLAK